MNLFKHNYVTKYQFQFSHLLELALRPNGPIWTKLWNYNTRLIYPDKLSTYLILTLYDSTKGSMPTNLSIHMRYVSNGVNTTYHTVHRINALLSFVNISDQNGIKDYRFTIPIIVSSTPLYDCE